MFEVGILKGKQSIGTISQEDLDLAGNLLCGINKAGIDRINHTAIEANIRTIDECTTLGKTEREAALSLYTSVKQITSGTKVKATTLIDLGTLATALPTDIINDIPPEILAEGAPFSMEAIEGKKKSLGIRKKAGFKNDITADEQASSDKMEKYFEAKCATALETTHETATSRKRRSIDSLTCSDMQLLGTSGLSALTTTQISNLADQAFIDCAETLGSVTGYSNTQKDALLVVATRVTVWGNPSTWLTTDIYSAGVICQAMTVAQIASLNLDLDTVSRLGQFDGWDTLKKKAVFDRWLSQHKSGDSSTITSSELRSLGHITCGAETSHINNIQLSVYQSAVDAIGELTSCENNQLQAFVSHAKNAYGSDVTTWDSTVITNVGTSIGGLSASEIAKLTALQIDVVDPNHVSYIPDSIFSGFTVSQITTFSPAQAQSTTSSQRAALTSPQLDALSTVGSITWKAAESGVGLVISSWPVTVLMTALTMCKCNLH
ncbi:otoancorin-like [Pecten maximus]|uniref:otoancorin-like n=1 Tax=Pecten maximus TaxID=6579 RepID=UPI00145816C4|nr:otoancorin-like [Pecten maximus]